MVARTVRDREVVGSNPAAPTIYQKELLNNSSFFIWATEQANCFACVGRRRPERCFCLRAEKGDLSRKAKTARPGPKDFYVRKNTAGESRRPDHLERHFLRSAFFVV